MFRVFTLIVLIATVLFVDGQTVDCTGVAFPTYTTNGNIRSNTVTLAGASGTTKVLVDTDPNLRYIIKIEKSDMSQFNFQLMCEYQNCCKAGKKYLNFELVGTGSSFASSSCVPGCGPSTTCSGTAGSRLRFEFKKNPDNFTACCMLTYS